MQTPTEGPGAPPIVPRIESENPPPRPPRPPAPPPPPTEPPDDVVTLPVIAACQHSGRQLALVIGLAGAVLVAWREVRATQQAFEQGFATNLMIAAGILVSLATVMLVLRVIDEQVSPKNQDLARIIAVLLGLLYALMVRFPQ